MHIKTSDQEIMRLGLGDYHCNWGLHMAGLYETPEQRDKLLIGFLSAGAQDGDLLFYYPVERSTEDFKSQFAHRFPDLADALGDAARFQCSPARELYCPDGVFSPGVMSTRLDEMYADTQADGTRNIRVGAEMAWALEGAPGREHLFAYEACFNYFVQDKPWAGLCLYDITKFSGEAVLGVLQTHPYTLSSTGITENPLFTSPEDWLREHAPEFLPGKN
jgi:hypothetical protein